MPRGKANRKYSGEFKQTVVETMTKEQLGYQETAERFGILKQRVFDWERIYLAEETEGLYKERRGRNDCGRPKSFPTKVEEDLLAEVQRLRAENAYLKTCKPWFWKTSDASTKNAGSSGTEAAIRSETSSLNRSTVPCNFLLSCQTNAYSR